MSLQNYTVRLISVTAVVITGTWNEPCWGYSLLESHPSSNEEVYLGVFLPWHCGKKYPGRPKEGRRDQLHKEGLGKGNWSSAVHDDVMRQTDIQTMYLFLHECLLNNLLSRTVWFPVMGRMWPAICILSNRDLCLYLLTSIVSSHGSS
jgi:hypothetical protein